MYIVRRGLLFGLVFLILVSCGQASNSYAKAPAAESVNLPAYKPDHIVIVVEENHSFRKIIGNKDAPYMSALAKHGALFTGSHGVQHPSEPNYLVLFSGSNQGVKDDSCPHTFANTMNLGSELLKHRYTFAGYSEDLPAAGSAVCTHKEYGRKHNPWSDFTNVPKSASMPFTEFPTDLDKLPAVSFVIPNMNHDMHDGTVKQADLWLKDHLDSYVKWAGKHNSLLILTWDEDDFSRSNHIPTIFAGPMIKTGVYAETINHLNVLRTIEDLYGLAHSGQSGSVLPIRDVWKK